MSVVEAGFFKGIVRCYNEEMFNERKAAIES